MSDTCPICPTCLTKLKNFIGDLRVTYKVISESLSVLPTPIPVSKNIGVSRTPSIFFLIYSVSGTVVYYLLNSNECIFTLF